MTGERDTVLSVTLILSLKEDRKDTWMMRRKHYEGDDTAFPADAYRVKNRGVAVAWHVLGWETEPDEDTEWSGYEQRTGRVVLQMVGDDAHHVYDPEDIEPLPRKEYCGSCGQIGCSADGWDREEG